MSSSGFIDLLTEGLGVASGAVGPSQNESPEIGAAKLEVMTEAKFHRAHNCPTKTSANIRRLATSNPAVISKIPIRDSAAFHSRRTLPRGAFSEFCVEGEVDTPALDARSVRGFSVGQ